MVARFLDQTLPIYMLERFVQLSREILAALPVEMTLTPTLFLLGMLTLPLLMVRTLQLPLQMLKPSFLVQAQMLPLPVARLALTLSLPVPTLCPSARRSNHSRMSLLSLRQGQPSLPAQPGPTARLQLLSI